ncbi:MAG: hypothetical protein ACE15B_19485 [Bryobacteraceae bacterium]
MKRAICVVPVQLYDPELAGEYQPGAVLEGERASLALQRYPNYFRPANGKKEKE